MCARCVLFSEAHRLDYNCGADAFAEAPQTRRAGKTVTLSLRPAAGKTPYLYLDGKLLRPTDTGGLSYRFPMPPHDVHIDLCFAGADDPQPPKRTLADSYKRSVGRPQTYSEFILSTYSETQLLLEVSRSGPPPEKTAYLVPVQAAEDVFAAIRRNKMADWNAKKDDVSIRGAVFVCRFPKGNGYECVSSEHMPEDGKNAFQEVRSALAAYCKDEYAVKKP